MLHFFRVTIYICCTLIKLHDIHVALFWCCNCPFCTLYMLHSFHVAFISHCTFSVLHFFLVALFSGCTLFMLHLFTCCTFSMLHFFSFYFKLHFFMLHSFCIALFLCCDLFILYSLHVAPFWVLHFVQVALIFYCSFFCVALISCCTFCVVTIGGWRRRYVSPFLEISISILFCYCPHFENFPKTKPFPPYYLDPSYYVKWKFFQGLNHRLNHQLKTRIAYFICQCKNYSCWSFALWRESATLL